MADYNITMKQKNASGGYDNLYPATTIGQVSGAMTPLATRTIVNNGWKLLQKYDTAGSGTWIAPDLFNGQIYKIGVYIIGGGGGGAGINVDSNTKPRLCVGGCSGFAKAMTLNVTPGSAYNYVVGAGGAGGAGNGKGLIGSSSSFNNVVAYGGYGGYNSTVAPGAKNMMDGGEVSYGEKSSSSSDMTFADNGFNVVGRCGLISNNYITSYANRVQTEFTYCPFDPDLRLCSGQAIIVDYYQGSRNPSSNVQGAFESPYGRSSASVAANAVDANATASPGTMPGCGGGSASIFYNNSVIGVANGAKGADGGVFIFVEGKA